MTLGNKIEQEKHNLRFLQNETETSPQVWDNGL